MGVRRWRGFCQRRTTSSVIRDTLEEWNLIVNEAKTESVHIHLDNPSGQEAWRNSKSLGSLLCSKADLTRRCHIGTVTFHSLWAMWLRRPLLTLEKRLLTTNPSLCMKECIKVLSTSICLTHFSCSRTVMVCAIMAWPIPGPGLCWQWNTIILLPHTTVCLSHN